MSFGGRSSLGVQNTAHTRQVYSFPLLKAEEIVQCIREMQIPVTEEEIRTANPVAIRRIFEAFIEIVIGVTKEELAQPAFSGLGKLDYPELHEESIPELQFFRAVSKMMNACGAYEFSLRDINAPVPKRLRRQLSAIINFAKFREERMTAFSELSLKTDAHLDQRQHELEELQVLEKKLADLQSQKFAEEPAIRQLEEECSTLESEINTLNKNQAILRHELHELKKNNEQLKDDISSKQFNILDAMDQVQKYNSQIVNSPERFKMEICQIAAILEEEKKEFAIMDNKYRQVTVSLDKLSRAEKETIKVIQVVEEVEEAFQRCKMATKETKSKTLLIEKSQRKISDSTARKQRLSKLLDQKTDQLNNLRRQRDLKESAADQALLAAKHDLGVINSEDQRLLLETEEKERILGEVDRKAIQEETYYVTELNDLIQRYKKMEKSICSYNTKILECVSLASTTKLTS